MAFLNDEELDRFLDKALVPDTKSDCWFWLGGCNNKGYGCFGLIRRGRASTWLAHRVAYLHYRGEIPPDKECDHACRQPGCVNPWHIELVPHIVNVRRGRAGWHMREKTHCINGHEFTEENTRPRGKHRRHRACRECDREKGRARLRRFRSLRAT